MVAFQHLLAAFPFSQLVTTTQAVTTNQTSTLTPFVYNDIPLGSITPNGWLRAEMETEAAGLAGSLYDFWMYVRDSTWLGGTTEYSGLNEAFPYWLNGLVPLAYSLNDARLKSQVHEAMDYMLSHIQSDGWVGPEVGGNRLIWARTLVFLGWTNLADANSTYTQPVVNAMHNYNKLMLSMLRNNGTGMVVQANSTLDEGYYFWGRGRVQDLMVSLQWLYDKHPEGNEAELLESMQLLHEYGWNWEDWFNKEAYTFGNLYDYPDAVSDDNYQYLHGVNVGEGLKAAAVVRRYTKNDSLIQTAKDGSDWTFQYHGAAYGSVLADEREDGITPWTGSELCTAVEVIFSQAYNYRALGDSSYADSAELAAFNALPGAITGDWWAHQYMSQTNQPFAKNLTGTPFYNVNTVGQTFGLEPNYPCCTANHPQGLPKFLQSTFVTTGTSGIVHALLCPATVSTAIAGGQVTIECETNYPFEDTLFYTITNEQRFDFHVRVPTWAKTAVLEDSKGHSSSRVGDSLLNVSLPKGTNRLMYTIGTDIRTTARANDTVAVYRGQLLYAISIDAQITSTGPHAYFNQSLYSPTYAPAQSRDYTMINATDWNIAIDPSTLQYSSGHSKNYTVNDSPVELKSPIFAPGAPPMFITAKACLIDWPLLEGGSVGAPPTGAARKCLGDTFETKLVPYGSAKLHMTELPTIDLST